MTLKIAWGNVRKSLRDFAIYFVTVVLGVAVFYAFNSMGAQQGVIRLSQTQSGIMGLLSNVIGIVSVLVAFVLVYLVVYANRFLIRRRKKEFGTYLLLGMGTGDVVRIVLAESAIVGAASLAVGLALGIGFSQLLLLATSALFKAEVASESGFAFVFSPEAFVGFIALFAAIFVLAAIVNSRTVARAKLIDLMQAESRLEEMKLRSLPLSIALFAASCVLVVAGTALFFYSLSGVLLRAIKSIRPLYLRGLNAFTLRQLNARVNTAFATLTVVCLVLFLAITSVCGGMGLRNATEDSLAKGAAYSFSASTTFGMAGLDGEYHAIEYPDDVLAFAQSVGYDMREGLAESAKAAGLGDFDSLVSESAQVDSLFLPGSPVTYGSIEQAAGVTLADVADSSMITNEDYPAYSVNVMRLSQVNAALELAGKEPLRLAPGECAVVSDMDALAPFWERDGGLACADVAFPQRVLRAERRHLGYGELPCHLHGLRARGRLRRHPRHPAALRRLRQRASLRALAQARRARGHGVPRAVRPGARVLPLPARTRGGAFRLRAFGGGGRGAAVRPLRHRADRVSRVERVRRGVRRPFRADISGCAQARERLEARKRSRALKAPRRLRRPPPVPVLPYTPYSVWRAVRGLLIMSGMENEALNNLLVREREMKPKDWAVDAGVAAAAFVFGCVQLMLSASLILPDEAFCRLLGIEAVVPTSSAFFALALTTFPLVVRRKMPWVAFVFVFVAFLASQSTFRGFSLAIVGPMVALLTISCECSRVEAGVALGISVVGLAIAPQGGSSAAMWFWAYVQNAVFMIAAATGGFAFRSHREYVRAAEQRAEEAERTREEVAARRVEEERVRIAREVHDITAHSLSAVSVQLAAAERLIERDPEAAKETVACARKTAKSALGEIRSMIGVLRSGDSPAETAPTDGTERLEDLARFLREAGIEASLDTEAYDRASVPVYIDVALFGIAREATTNIVRHAHAKRAKIELSLAGRVAYLRVENDAAGASPRTENDAREGHAATSADWGASGSGGHGIVGMRERARLLGGTLTATSRPDGGFVVSASIPCAPHGETAGDMGDEERNR